MVEKIGEIEKQGAEQEQEVQAFEWNFAFNREEKRKLNPTDKVTASMYRPDGNYDDEDFTDQRKALHSTLYDEASNPKKGLEAVYNSLEFARHFGVKPAIEEIEQSGVAPLEAQKKIEEEARIADKIAKAEATYKNQTAKEKRLAELQRQIAELDKKIEATHNRVAAKAQKKLETAYGPSWENRHFKFVSMIGKTATKELVTPVKEDPQEDVIQAKPLIVSRSVEDAERDIAESNTEASGVDANKAEIGLLAGAAIESEEEPQELTLDEVEQLGDGDVVVEKDKTEVDYSDAVTPVEAFGSLAKDKEAREERLKLWQEEQEAKEQPKGLRARVKARWNKLTKNEEGKYSKKKLALGALALGAAAVAVNYGLEHTGHEGVIAQAGDVVNSIKSFLGMDTAKHVSQHTETVNNGLNFNGLESQMDEISKQANQNLEAAQLAAAAAEKAQHAREAVEAARDNAQYIQGSAEHVKHFRLEGGGNIWNHVESTVRAHHSNWTEQQIQTRTWNEVDNVLKQTGQSWDSARSLPVGWTTKG